MTNLAPVAILFGLREINYSCCNNCTRTKRYSGLRVVVLSSIGINHFLAVFLRKILTLSTAPMFLDVYRVYT